MLNWQLVGQFLAMITAAIIFVVAVVAGSLYRKAYLEMKKTRIIGALMWLLFSISLKFLVIMCSFWILWVLGIELVTFNAIQSLPNLFVIWALMNFVYSSISTQEEVKNCLAEVNKKDIRKSLR